MPSDMSGVEFPITMYLLLYICLMSLEAHAVNQMDFFFFRQLTSGDFRAHSPASPQNQRSSSMSVWL